MPHSSGGGSHGGGTHGGSHGGSSGPRISTHYFAGARRYRKHHISTGRDEYVYASSKPRKAGLGSVIFISIFSAVFFGGSSMAVIGSAPKKLNTHYLDTPAVHDDIDVIADDEALTETLYEYQELTGICPVIYTTYHEDWKGFYEDLESYSYYTYTSNFSDEAHFVIVYSIPVADREYMLEDSDYVPHFKWEATQGNDTDPIITENYFLKFADKVQDGLESGEDAGEAFDDAIKFAYKKAENVLKPGSAGRFVNILGSLFPLLIVAGFLGLFLFLSIRQYRKDKDIEYDEVPLDVEPQDPKHVLNTAVTGNYHSKEVSYDLSKGGPITTGAKILVLGVTIPFAAVGIMIIAAGALMTAKAESSGGVFLIVFGIIWTFISVFTLLKMIIAMAKAKTDPDTMSSDAEHTDSKPAETMYQPQTVPTQEQPQFDLRYFSDPQNNIENDDEDYRRMKRQGFE